jgi:transglutaminase-like putative cysteine protease
MLQKTHFLTILIVFSTLTLFSQPYKWGETFGEDLKMTSYPEDTSAKAVVLQDIGNITFDSTRRDGKLLDLDVVVINPDGTKTPVKSANIYTEKLSKYYSAKKVFIPNLQKGSIIEYRFELVTNNFLRLTEWNFQEDLPVRWSEINAHIPEFYNYLTLSNITFPIVINETNRKNGNFYYRGEYYSTVHFRKALKNIPALKNEPFVTTIDDYRNKLEFQLKEYTYPGQVTIPVYESWPKLAKELSKDTDFGDQYLKTSKSKVLVEAAANLLKNTDLPEEERLAKLLEFVTTNIKWNKETWLYKDKGINDAFTDHQGNMADINLGLVALCKAAGFEAHPMLISTREHGHMTPEYPIVNQFDAVLTYVELKDKTFRILDGTSPFHGVNMAAPEHYNRGGWVMREKDPIWIEVTAPERVSIVTGALDLDETGNLKGKMRLSVNGHEALEFRNKIANDPEGKYMKNEFSGKFEDFKIDSLSFDNVKDFTKPLNIRFNISIPNAAQVANDFIYCPAITTFFIKENPFKAISRFCPVNYESTLKAQYIVTINAPKSYKVEEMPAALSLLLPNDAGKMTFACGPTPSGETQVVMRLNIKQIDYTSDEYFSLQEFYGKVVEKTQDQIVFKKL